MPATLRRLARYTIFNVSKLTPAGAGGVLSFMSSNASTTRSATTKFRYHFRLAGTIYQGASVWWPGTSSNLHMSARASVLPIPFAELPTFSGSRMRAPPRSALLGYGERIEDGGPSRQQFFKLVDLVFKSLCRTLDESSFGWPPCEAHLRSATRPFKIPIFPGRTPRGGTRQRKSWAIRSCRGA